MIVLTKSDEIDRLELAKEGIQVSSSLTDVSELASQDKIIVFENMAVDEGFIGWVKTIAFLSSAEVYFVYKDRIEVAIELKEHAICRYVDSGIINLTFINFVLYNDEFDKQNIDNFDNDQVVMDIINSTDVNHIMSNIAYIKYTLINGLNMKRETNSLKNRIDIMGIELATKDETIKEQKAQIEELSEGYSLVKEKFLKNRNLLERCIYSEDSFSVVQTKRYLNPPRIIYLKNVLDLMHFDSFCVTLKSMINAKFAASCKVVHLVNSKYINEVHTLKEHWYVASDSYNLKKVRTSDYIVKGGDYLELLNYFMNNDLELNYLIVIDSLGIEKDIVLGKYFKFYLCRNFSALESLGLDIRNTIVNNAPSKEYMSVDTIDRGFYSNADELTRMYALSRQSAIKSIIKTIEIGERSLR